jgi:hypothetical protein
VILIPKMRHEKHFEFKVEPFGWVQTAGKRVQGGSLGYLCLSLEVGFTRYSNPACKESESEAGELCDFSLNKARHSLFTARGT